MLQAALQQLEAQEVGHHPEKTKEESLEPHAKSFYEQAVELVARKGKDLLEKIKIEEEEIGWLLHAHHLIHHPLFKNIHSKQKQKVWFYQGIFFKIFGNDEEALKAFEVAIEISSNSNLKAASWNHMGLILLKNNKLDIAKSHFETAMQLSSTPTSQAASCENMGHFCFKLKQFQEAKEHYTKSYQLRKKANPEEKPTLSLAISLAGLGNACAALNEESEARDHFLKAAKIHQKISGLKAQVEMAKLTIDRGDLEFNSRNFQKAKKYYQNVLKMRNEIYGSSGNPNLAYLLSKLALTFFILNQYEEAKKVYFEAYQLLVELEKENTTGKEMIHCLESLGILSRLMGEYEESRKFHRSAYEILLENQESDLEPERVDSLENLSLAHQASDYHEKALKYAEDAYERAKILYGEVDHPRVASTLITLSRACLNLKDLVKAKEYALKAEDIYKRSEGNLTSLKDFLDRGKFLHQLGNISFEENEIVQAKNFYMEELLLLRSDPTFNFRKAEVDCLCSIGRLNFNQQEYSEAKIFFEDALKIYREIFANDKHPGIQYALSSIREIQDKLEPEKSLENNQNKPGDKPEKEKPLSTENPNNNWCNAM